MSRRLRTIRSRTSFAVVASVLLTVSCTGSGSDIGPNLTPLEQDVFKVSVRDPMGRPVIDARVTLGTREALSAASGTAEIEAPFSPSTRLDVDAAFASAVDGQRLGSLRVDLPEPASTDSQTPFVVHLPDLAGSPEQLTTMPLVGPATLDDSGRTGSVLSFEAGTSFPSTDGPIRIGSLAADRIPPLTPTTGPVSGPVVVNDATFVGPLDASIVPAATIEFPNTLGLAGGSAVMVARLSSTTGVWETVGPGSVSGDGARIVATSLVSTGGLYTAFVPTDTVTLFGQVLLDAVSRAPGQRLQLRSGQAFTVTDDNGSFVLPGVPLRPMATLRIDGGLDAGSDVVTVDVDLSTALDGDMVDLEDVLYDFVPTTDFRAQVLSRSVLRRFARIGLNSLSGDRGVALATDANGQIEVSDAIGGLMSVFDATLNPRNPQQVLAIENFVFVDLLRRTDDNSIFTDPQSIAFPPGGTLLYVRDRSSRGFATGVDVYAEQEAGDPIVIATTPELPPGLPPIVPTPTAGDVIAIARRQTADGTPFVSAQTIVGLASGRVEFVVDVRPARPRARTVLVEGTIPGVGTEFEVLNAPIVDRDGFFELFLDGLPIGETLPGPIDDVGTGDPDFVAAARARRGATMVATAGVASGARRELRSVSLFEIDPADRATSVVPDFETVDTMSARRFASALVDLDPALSTVEPRAVVGLQRPDGRVAVLGSDLAVVAEANGDGAVMLPTSQGVLSGAIPIGFVEVVDDTAPVRRRQVSAFPRGPEYSAPLLGVPTLTTPADEDAVPVLGFDVEFALPIGALYGRISLVREDGLVEWSVVVPQPETSVTFAPLTDDESILEPGRYELRVEAVRVADDSPMFGQILDPYQSFLGRQVSLGSAERLVSAISSVTIDLDVVP